MGGARCLTKLALIAGFAGACDAPRPSPQPAAPAETKASSPTSGLFGRAMRLDGTPLNGAIVRAEPMPVFKGVPDARQAVETTAAADGSYELKTVGDGDWAVRCSADGAFRVMAGVVRVPDVARFDVVLSPGPVFEGTLIDDVTEKPLGGAKVQGWGERGVLAEVVTSADGRWSFDLHRERVSVNEYRVDVPGCCPHPGGFTMGCCWDIFTAGDRVELKLRARRASVVRGVVTGPAGPVAGATVSAFYSMSAPGEGDGYHITQRTTTDISGAYEFRGIEGSDFAVSVAAPGLVQREISELPVDPADWTGGMHDVAEHASRVFLPEYTEAPPTAPAVHDIGLVPVTFKRCDVTGQVRAADGAPVAGAVVRAGIGKDFVETNSADDGAFALKGVATDGKHAWVAVSREWFVDASVKVEVPIDEPVDVELVAEPRVRGRVLDEHGNGVAGARVALLSTDDSDVSASEVVPPLPARAAMDAVTDSQGRYLMSVVGRNRGNWVVASAPGFVSARTEESSVEGGRDTEQYVALASMKPLTGRVVRAGGDEPAANVNVAFVVNPDDESERDDDQRILAVTSADGSFRVERMPTGKRKLRASGAGWLPSTVDVDLSNASSVRIEIEPSMTFAGRLVFEDGKPAVNVDVDLYDHPREQGGAWGEQAGPSVHSHADGQFALHGLKSGRYWVGVQWGEPQVVTASIGPFEIGPERTIPVVLGAVIEGRLVDLTGQAVTAEALRDIDVEFAPSDGDRRPSGRGRIGDDGALHVGGLDHGLYDVEVKSRRHRPFKLAGVRAGGEPLVLKLDPGLSIEGRVLGVDGKPLVSVWIVARPDDLAVGVGEPDRQTATDDAGAFRVSGLTPGGWRLSFLGDGVSRGGRRLATGVVFAAGAKDVTAQCVAVETSPK